LIGKWGGGKSFGGDLNVGDSHCTVDWKAESKLSKLTVKEKRPFGFKQTWLPLDILKMFCFNAENSAFTKCVILNV
jgi:uncharacterized protein (DUF58 family)